MSVATTKFKHMSYLWHEVKAASMVGDEVILLVYRYNLIGVDLRLTNYGGGNTSFKVMAKESVKQALVSILFFCILALTSYSVF